MPADTWTDISRMAGCFAAVAAGAAPVGLGCRALARRRPPVPLRPARVGWTGLDVILAFLVFGIAVPQVVAWGLAASGLYRHVYGPDFPSGGSDDPVAAAVRGLWAGLVAVPLQLAGMVAARALLVADVPRAGSWPAAVAAGVRWWVVLTPPVLFLHAAVNALFVWLGHAPEEHPLTRLGAERPRLDQLLFAVQAGVAAPFLEEVLFRGVLLGWLLTGRGRWTELRVWSTLAAAVAFALLTGAAGPTAFASLIVLGWGGLRLVARKRRTLGGVYASAALFAAIHSSVWPTPIPLFALGVGLGWVALRTNSVLAPAVVHGLFNTVSVLFVLSGGAK